MPSSAAALWVFAMADIIVAGAGITGITTAYALLRRGHSVTIVDKHRYPAMETSYANGGQLSASNAEVWNSWSTIMKAIKWMMKADAPFLINPMPSFHKYSWLSEFCYNIKDYRQNTIETTRLAISARQHLFSIAELEGIDFDLLQKGILHIYHDRASFEKAARSNLLMREGGLDRYPVTPDEIKEGRSNPRCTATIMAVSIRLRIPPETFTNSREGLRRSANAMARPSGLKPVSRRRRRWTTESWSHSRRVCPSPAKIFEPTES